MPPRCYVFIMSSLNHPIYRILQHKRRKLLEKYKVPYTVVMNGKYQPIDATYPPLLDDEIMYPMPGYNPSMTLKFLQAVKLYFRSFSTWEEVPDYIIRLNATVYLHYPSLWEYLETLPRERVLAGPVNKSMTKTFVNGMVMIFSKEVLRHILQDPRVNEQKMLHEYDDVALSMLAQPYCEFHDMMPFFVYPSSQNTLAQGIFDLSRIPTHKKWLFRIRHDGSHRQSDIKNWDQLMAHFDEEHESFTGTLATPLQNRYSLWLWILFCIVGLVIMVVLISNIRSKI